MQPLSLDRTKPNAFILVSEGKFSDCLPNADHVWALNLDTRDPQPFSLSTTYGLRAKSMHVFPEFIYKNRRISMPDDFIKPPRVTCYTPSSVQIEASYGNDFEFTFTCYLPEPDVLTGGIQIKNLDEKPIEITAQLAAKLVPMGKGQPLHPEKSGPNHFLAGKTDGLEPVLFMTGGPTAINNPFPALTIQLTIQAHQSQEIFWVLVSKESKTSSFEKARTVITNSWQEGYLPNVKHSERHNIQIKTGNPDWDAAFLLAQIHARTHFVKCVGAENPFQFIKTRLPDQSNVNQDNPSVTKALSNLELHHLCQVMMPASLDLFADLLEKHIINQLENENPKPEENIFSGSRKTNGCPLLATTVLEVYEVTQNHAYLADLFPYLTQLFRSWVSDQATGDEKAHIVWETASQLQIDTGLFTYDFWESFCKGLDISKSESPALYAMLYKEAKALYKISKILGERSQMRTFSRWQKELFKRLENCWHEEEGTYSYQDIHTHLSPERELYFPSPVKSRVEIKKRFTKPQRLQCHISTSDEHTRVCNVKITGLSIKGESVEEVFKSPDILWVMGRAHLTTDNVFREISTISFDGLKPGDSFILETADFTQKDISCLLPLWAEAGSETHRQTLASSWFDSNKDAFSRGIPETWPGKGGLPEKLPIMINVLWNTLIIEGFVNQGKSDAAVNLYTNLMGSILHGLKNYQGFYPLFDQKNGHPCGQRNAITGLIPLQLFLKIAGIKLFSPNKIAVWGNNPFPWPIEVHWQGLSFIKEGVHTSIILPNGTTAYHDSGKPVMISSEMD
jgi:hypothetical protein